MRYVCDIAKIISLILFPLYISCVPTAPVAAREPLSVTRSFSDSASDVEETFSAFSLDDQGCLARAVAHRRQYFDKAVVTIQSVKPRAEEPLVDAILDLEPPIAVDLLNPQAGLAEILQALPPGVYKSAELRVIAAEIVLRAQPTIVQGLNIKNQSIELDFLVPLQAPESPPDRWSVATCLDSLKVKQGTPSFDPPRVQVSSAIPQE